MQLLRLPTPAAAAKAVQLVLAAAADAADAAIAGVAVAAAAAVAAEVLPGAAAGQHQPCLHSLLAVKQQLRSADWLLSVWALPVAAAAAG